MLCCRVAGRGLLALVVVLNVGCRAGHPRGEQSRFAVETPDPVGSSTLRSSGGRHFSDLSEADLRHVLIETSVGGAAADAGRVLYKAVQVQGGWEHWRSLGEVSYRRVRRVHESGGDEKSDGTSGGTSDGTLDGTSDGGTPDGEASNGDGSSLVQSGEQRFAWVPSDWRSEAERERWFFALPFALVEPDYAREFLGVEIDLREEARFEKVKFFRVVPGDGSNLGPARVIIGFFNQDSGALTRVQFKWDDAQWVQIRFGGWQDVAGLRLPTRRDFYVFDREFRYVREEDLAWTDELSEVKSARLEVDLSNDP